MYIHQGQSDLGLHCLFLYVFFQVNSIWILKNRKCKWYYLSILFSYRIKHSHFLFKKKKNWPRDPDPTFSCWYGRVRGNKAYFKVGLTAWFTNMYPPLYQSWPVGLTYGPWWVNLILLHVNKGADTPALPSSLISAFILWIKSSYNKLPPCKVSVI